LIEAPIVKRLLDEEFGKVRAACLNLLGHGRGRIEQHHAAEAASRAVNALFAVLRDGAGVATEAGTLQIDEAEAGDPAGQA
jgi:hypothetical protein